MTSRKQAMALVSSAIATKAAQAPAKEITLATLSDAAVEHVANAAHAQARSDVAAGMARALAIAEMTAAGIQDAALQPALRAEYVAAYVAARLDGAGRFDAAALMAQARAILAKPGPTSQAVERRTASEDTYCVAARKSWSRLLGWCNADSAEARGGARVKDGAKPDANAAPVAEPEPKTPGDVVAHVAHAAATLGLYVRKYQAAGIVIPAAILRAVSTFAHDVAEATKTEPTPKTKRSK